MPTVKIVYWEEEEGGGLGICRTTPITGPRKTLDDLKDHLKDLYQDVTSGQIPGIRKVGDLVISHETSGSSSRRLEKMGCILERSRGKHDWYRNPTTGACQPVPRLLK